MNCIVCGKPVTLAGADICSSNCSLRATQGEFPEGSHHQQLRSRRIGAITSFPEKMQQLATAATPREQEMRMLKIAHPWMRNRNLVVGNTVFSFDSQGVATVKCLGTAKDDLEQLLKRPKFFIPGTEPPVVVPVVPPPVATPVTAIPIDPVPYDVVLEEKSEEEEEDTAPHRVEKSPIKKSVKKEESKSVKPVTTKRQK